MTKLYFLPIALLLLTSFVAVSSASWHIPPTYIPAGMKVHFGSEWISTTTPLLLTAWFENNWLNYTVTSSGTQQVYNGSKPYHVLIDGTQASEGSGWNYGSGIVTVSTALSSVAMEWGTAPDIPPHEMVIVPFVALPAQTYTSDYQVYGSCIFKFDQHQSLVCQHTTNVEMEMTVITGSFNGSGSMALSNDHGIISLVPTTDSIVQFSDLLGSGLIIKVNGQVVKVGDNVEIPATSETTIIEWTTNITPLLPFMFIMGMAGLGCLFISPIYVIQKFREHEYEKALITGLIIGVLGFAMFVGWLWST